MLKSEDLRQIRIDSSLLRLLTRNFAINWIVLPIAVTDSRIRIVIPDSHPEEQEDLAHRVSKVTRRAVDYDTAELDTLAETIRIHYDALESRVKNCNRRFLFKCPKVWEEMEKTDDRFVRHCEVCNRTVHFCFTEEDLALSISRRDCIAVYNPKANRTTSGIALGIASDEQRDKHEVAEQ